MPHQHCSICQRDDHEEIDIALASGQSLREVARQRGVSKSAIERHRNHARSVRRPMDARELARIDLEIRKLHCLETAAKKRKDGALAIKIARELRNWFALRTKAAAVLQAAEVQKEDSVAITPAEALALAKSVVESRLDDAEARAWIFALADRLKVAEEQSADSRAESPAVHSDEETSERD